MPITSNEIHGDGMSQHIRLSTYLVDPLRYSGIALLMPVYVTDGVSVLFQVAHMPRKMPYEARIPFTVYSTRYPIIHAILIDHGWRAMVYEDESGKELFMIPTPTGAAPKAESEVLVPPDRKATPVHIAEAEPCTLDKLCGPHVDPEEEPKKAPRKARYSKPRTEGASEACGLREGEYTSLVGSPRRSEVVTYALSEYYASIGVPQDMAVGGTTVIVTATDGGEVFRLCPDADHVRGFVVREAPLPPIVAHAGSDFRDDPDPIHQEVIETGIAARIIGPGKKGCIVRPNPYYLGVIEEDQDA